MPFHHEPQRPIAAMGLLLLIYLNIYTKCSSYLWLSYRADFLLSAEKVGSGFSETRLTLAAMRTAHGWGVLRTYQGAACMWNGAFSLR